MTKFTPEFIARYLDLHDEYGNDPLVDIHLEAEAFLNYPDALDEIERLQSDSALLDRFADYLRHHIAGHKCFDFPDAKALLAEWEGLRNDG